MKKLWIDVETTGLDPVSCAIWQLHAIAEYDGATREFSVKMRAHPGAKLEPKAMEMAGLSLVELQALPDPSDTFHRFIAWLKEIVNPYDRTDKFTVYGYNVPFDVSFIREWFKRNGSNSYQAVFWHPPVDIMSMAADYLLEQRPLFPNFKLGTVAGHFGLYTGNLHDAAADIRLTREIYLAILNGEQ